MHGDEMPWLFGILMIAFSLAGIGHLTCCYLLVHRLKKYHAAIFRELGIADPEDLLVNIPPHWPMQWRFLKYLLRGGLRDLNDPEVSRLATKALVTLGIGLGSWILWGLAVFMIE